ncbi:MAG TPA: hypothetical protein VHL57_00170 [Flavobacteriales bacterium]|jgi:hypothetical protein|nr:hypothetical protein [Flavobacteriales bacterium]
MRQRYRISPESGRERLSDADVARYRDGARLLHNYQKAARMMHRKPLYKDPRAFLALLIIVLIAILVAEAVDKDRKPSAPPTEQRP